MGETTHSLRCTAFALVAVAAAAFGGRLRRLERVGRHGSAGAAGGRASARRSPDTSTPSSVTPDELNGLPLEFKYGVPRARTCAARSPRQLPRSATTRPGSGRRSRRPACPASTTGPSSAAEFVAALHELEDRFDALHSEALDIPTGPGRAPADALLTPKMTGGDGSSEPADAAGAPALPGGKQDRLLVAS